MKISSVNILILNQGGPINNAIHIPEDPCGVGGGGGGEGCMVEGVTPLSPLSLEYSLIFALSPKYSLIFALSTECF